MRVCGRYEQVADRIGLLLVAAAAPVVERLMKDIIRRQLIYGCILALRLYGGVLTNIYFPISFSRSSLCICFTMAASLLYVGSTLG